MNAVVINNNISDHIIRFHIWLILITGAHITLNSIFTIPLFIILGMPILDIIGEVEKLICDVKKECDDIYISIDIQDLEESFPEFNDCEIFDEIEIIESSIIDL